MIHKIKKSCQINYCLAGFFCLVWKKFQSNFSGCKKLSLNSGVEFFFQCFFQKLCFGCKTKNRFKRNGKIYIADWYNGFACLVFLSGNLYSKCAIPWKEFAYFCFVVHWNLSFQVLGHIISNTFFWIRCVYELKCNYKYTIIYIKCQIEVIFYLSILQF